MSNPLDPTAGPSSEHRKTIWKFDLGPRPDRLPSLQPVRMPEGAIPLHVGLQDDDIEMWSVVDPTAPLVERQVFVIGTGQPCPDNAYYVGTVIVSPFWVLHVFVECDARTLCAE